MFCFLRPELSSSDWWYYKLVRIPADKSALSSEQSKWFIKTSRAVGIDWSKIFKNLASKEVVQKISPCRSAYLFCLWGGKPAIWNSNFAPPLWLRSTWNSDGIFLCFLFSFADTISITIRRWWSCSKAGLAANTAMAQRRPVHGNVIAAVWWRRWRR